MEQLDREENFPGISEYRRCARRLLIDEPPRSAFLVVQDPPDKSFGGQVERILGWMVLPLRLVLAMVTLLIGAVGFYFVSLGVTEMSYRPGVCVPISSIRAELLCQISRLGVVLLYFLGYTNVRVTIVGRGREPQRQDWNEIKRVIHEVARSPIIVSNHVCFLEVFGIIAYFAPSFIAKLSVREIPIIGRITTSLQALYLDRRDLNSRTEIRAEIIRRANWAGKGKFRPLLICPEGTVSNGRQIISFASGAFAPGVPVRPILIIHHRRGYFGGGHQSMGQVVINLARQLRNTLEIRILEEYYPSKEEKENPQLYANNVREVMAKELGVPVTDHSFMDVQLLIASQDLDPSLDGFSGASLNSFGSLILVNLHTFRSVPDSFRSIRRRCPSLVTLAEFRDHCNVLGLQNMSQALFDGFLDIRGCGETRFQEYVLGLMAICRVVINMLPFIAKKVPLRMPDFCNFVEIYGRAGALTASRKTLFSSWFSGAPQGLFVDLSQLLYHDPLRVSIVLLDLISKARAERRNEQAPTEMNSRVPS